MAVSIAKTEVGFQGRIVWTDAGGRSVGERLLSSRSRDCGEIAANLAFAVALQVQLVERGASKDGGSDVPDAERSPPTITDQTDRAPVIAERPNPPTESLPVPDQASPARLVLAVGVGPAVGVGMTPDATAFGRLFVVARLRRLSAEIGADAALPVTLREPDGTGVVVNAMGVERGGLRAHVGGVGLRARPARLDSRRGNRESPHRARHGGGSARSGYASPATRELGRFMVSVHADGLVMLSRWNVVLNDAVVWSVPRIGGVVGLDVALRFF